MCNRQLLLVLLLTLCAACERAATAPNLAEETQASTARPVHANTLPALFSAALHAAEREHGADAVSELLARWEARQAEVRAAHATGARGALEARLQALRTEEIRIVLAVMGPRIFTRVLSESSLQLALARARIFEAIRRGEDTSQAEARARQIGDLLSRAAVVGRSNPVGAMELATNAAALLASIDDLILDVRPIPTVETLFPAASQRLPPQELASHHSLKREAEAALDAGDRALLPERLAAVRAEEIRLVLKTHGDGTAAALLAEVTAALDQTRARVMLLERAGHDVHRLERILDSASDLYQHARAAERAGEAAKALDMASREAGLLNSMRHLTVK